MMKNYFGTDYPDRTLALIENGSWAPQAVKVMSKLFEESKDIVIAATVTIKGEATDANREQLDALAVEFSR